MKRWYATLPPATRNRNIQLSFKRNLDEVPVAPETHGLQSDIETVCFSGSIWIYAKQDLCDHHHDHHHDDHHHRHRHPPHHHHHHQQQQQQQQQQPNRTRTCILQKATPNVNRQLNMLGHFQLRDCSNISSTKVDWRHHAEAPLVSSDVSPVFLFLRDPYIVSECRYGEWRKSETPVDMVKHIKTNIPILSYTNTVPSWERSHVPYQSALLKMMFLSPRWDMWVPWRFVILPQLASRNPSGFVQYMETTSCLL